MNRSTPGLPVHHHPLEFTQTHVHRVGDAIQPSHPLSSPSPPAPSPSQHQSLFQWVNSLHEVARLHSKNFTFTPCNLWGRYYLHSPLNLRGWRIGLLSWRPTGLDLDNDQVNKASRNVMQTGHPLPPPKTQFNWRGGPNREENFW